MNINSNNQALAGLVRLTNKYDAAGEEIKSLMLQQAEGEKPDPDAFMHLLEKRSITQEAMSAQFKLYEKPLKTVLNETK